MKVTNQETARVSGQAREYAANPLTSNKASSSLGVIDVVGEANKANMGTGYIFLDGTVLAFTVSRLWLGKILDDCTRHILKDSL